MGWMMVVVVGVIFFANYTNAQTTYYWVGGTTAADVSADVWATSLGGTAVTPTVSNANIFIVDGSDISSTSGSQTGTVTINWTVATSTRQLGQFRLQNNATVTLTASSSGGRSYTIGGSIAGDDFVINDGSILNLSTYQSISMATSSTANISGRLNIESSRVFNTDATSVVTTVSSTGYIYNDQGSFTCTSSAKLIFNGGTYEHKLNAGTLPTATWNSGSFCKLTGITNTLPSSTNQTFHHFVWDNASQSGTVNLDETIISTNGDFQVLNTNSKNLTLGNSCSAYT